MGRLIDDGTDDISLTNTLTEIGHSKKMDHELDMASKMMAKLTESLDTDFRNNAENCSVFEDPSQQDCDVLVKKRTADQKRLGIVSTLSNSEPGKGSSYIVGYYIISVNSVPVNSPLC